MNKEEQLRTISRIISVDKDRERYFKHYDAVREFVLEKLKEDPLFKLLYCGTDLSGSCADGVKILKPDEFDCYVHLDFTKIGQINVHKGREPSTAYLRFPFHVDQRAYKFLDHNQYLIPKDVSSWMQGLIAKSVTSNRSTFRIDSEQYTMSFSTHGPAQTVNIDFCGGHFAIDFVLSVKLYPNVTWISDRRPVYGNNPPKNPYPPRYSAGGYSTQSSPDNDGKIYWNLVLKPHATDSLALKTSFTKMESLLIKDKNQLKNVLRLLKKIRNKDQLTSLKSYFIKTVCLWVDEEQGSAADLFWSKSIYDVLVVVLEKLIWCCERKYLPCFWDKKENMFGNIGHQLEYIKSVLSAELAKLKNDNSSVLGIFLNDQEMNSYRLEF